MSIAPLEIDVEFADVGDEDIQRVIKLAEEISPVWIALKNNVQVSWEYKIISGETIDKT